MCIYTERLILRKFTENDINEIFEIHKNNDVNKYLPWYPLKSLDEARIFFKEKYEKNKYNYAICLNGDNKPIGYINLSNEDSYDLGYGLKKDFWHKRMTTEASIAFINYLKKEGIPYITATHDIKNVRSGYVMKNIGMTYKYSYEENWQPKNILVTFRMYQLNLDGNEERVYKVYKGYWNKYPHFIEKDL